jgi:hypothetical protein
MERSLSEQNLRGSDTKCPTSRWSMKDLGDNEALRATIGRVAWNGRAYYMLYLARNEERIIIRRKIAKSYHAVLPTGSSALGLEIPTKVTQRLRDQHSSSRLRFENTTQSGSRFTLLLLSNRSLSRNGHNSAILYHLSQGLWATLHDKKVNSGLIGVIGPATRGPSLKLRHFIGCARRRELVVKIRYQCFMPCGCPLLRLLCYIMARSPQI